LLLTPALSSFGEERENYFVGRFPGVAAARQHRANFRSAFSAAEARPAIWLYSNSRQFVKFVSKSFHGFGVAAGVAVCPESLPCGREGGGFGIRH
jgi:hypothetical protein